MNYYNEIDKKAAAWLRELIVWDVIAPGIVDERSIKDVRPNDLAGFTQCHFFAGIGVWSYALRRAGWPDRRPVWTGSCPCQPFSNAGRGDGVADERHLWPHFFQLIAQCRPPVVLGEQVASKDGLAWLDLVQSDMEGSDHAFAAADLCAAGVGAPHIRQRLFFAAKSLADAAGIERAGGSGHLDGRSGLWIPGPAVSGGNGSVADTQRPGLQVRADRDVCGAVGHDEGRLAVESGDGSVRGVGHASSGGCGELGHALGAGHSGHADGAGRDGGLADATQPGQRVVGWGGGAGAGDARPHADVDHDGHRPGPTNGHWAAPDWIFCRDGKWRPVEAGTFPLAHGAPERVGLLRGYGNAIVAEVAETFIASYLDIEGVIA